MRDFALYTCVGAAGTAVHYAVLVLLGAAVRGPCSAAGAVWMSTLGAVLGAVTNYSLNRRYILRSRRRQREAAPRYALVAGAGLAINAAAVGSLCAAGLTLGAAQLAATAAALVGGFLLNRCWTFA